MLHNFRKILVEAMNKVVSGINRLIDAISPPVTYYVGEQEVDAKLYQRVKAQLQKEINTETRDSRDVGSCAAVEVFFMISNDAAKYTYDIIRREKRAQLDFSPSFFIIQCRENGKVIRVDEDAFHLFFTADRDRAVFNMRI